MDIKEIKDLIKFLDKTDIKEFEYENSEESIYISKVGETQQIIAQLSMRQLLFSRQLRWPLHLFRRMPPCGSSRYER